jgi:hypothetical protein
MASKRAQRRKECLGKIRHVNALAAYAHIRALFRTKGYQGRLNAYHCRFCNGFHVGHAPRK